MMWTQWEIPSAYSCEEIESESTTGETGPINMYELECKYVTDLEKLLQNRDIPYKLRAWDDNDCAVSVFHNGQVTWSPCDLDGHATVRVSLDKDGAVKFDNLERTLTYLGAERAFYKEYDHAPAK